VFLARFFAEAILLSPENTNLGEMINFIIILNAELLLIGRQSSKIRCEVPPAKVAMQ